jgi:hypothetical protein
VIHFRLRRHNYLTDIGGDLPVAQYVYDLVAADGFYFPTKRRGYAHYARGPGLKP